MFSYKVDFKIPIPQHVDYTPVTPTHDLKIFTRAQWRRQKIVKSLALK